MDIYYVGIYVYIGMNICNLYVSTDSWYIKIIKLIMEVLEYILCYFCSNL